MYYKKTLKENKERPRVSARSRLLPGKASSFIGHAINEIKPGDLVLLCCRVSRHTQEYSGNLADQEKNLRTRAEKLGVTVIEVFTHVGSGCDPYWLALPAEKAKQLGAKLFAETTDRLIRHPGYHSGRWPNAQARNTELEDLRWWTSGVILTTDLNPDAIPSEVRSYQRKRGQVAKGNKGGRPRIFNEQRKLLDAVKKLWRSLPL